MEGVDLDYLLQSHGEDFDADGYSAADHHHRRTVDEILLNHSAESSPSPSPPPEEEDEVVATTSNRTEQGAARVLPQLFGGGVIRSNAKPGAALAAAAAASRPIASPYATAMKLRRRASTGDALAVASKASESNRADASSDLDGIRVTPSPFLVNNSNLPVEEQEVKLERFYSVQLDLVAEEVDSGTILEQSAELVTDARTLIEAADDENETDYQDNERLVSIIETHSASSLENEKDAVLDYVNENEQVLSPAVREKDDVNSVDEFGGSAEAILSTHKSNENTSDFGNVTSEPGDSNDVSAQSDVTDIAVDEVFQSEIKSHDTKPEGISQPSLKALELAEEMEKKQAFTALHYEEGAAAQPMRLDDSRKGTASLGYFDVSYNNSITRTISSPTFRREHGSLQVVAVHSNYIAIGMSRGTILIVPSKYTTHHIDNMDNKMSLLGLQGDRSLVPVTSLCFNQQGDLLFSGYGDGHYTVWEVQKASALKVVTEHKAPVVHILYLGQDAQLTRQFNVVSGDSKGVFKLIRFSVVPWLNRISYTKATELLDETTSRVVCASPLLCGEVHESAMMSSHGSSAFSINSSGGTAGSIVNESVVIFITHQSALVAKVSPSVEVYAQIAKPDDVREDAMPYAAWRYMSLPPNSSSVDRVSLLAIAWDQKVQIAELVNAKLKVTEKWTLGSPAISVAWLDDQMLVVLTSEAQLYLFAKDGNVIHQTTFSVDGLRGDDLISHHIYFMNAVGNAKKAYHNSIAVRGATIYIIGPEHLVVSRLLSWKERIEVLRKAGDWIGALNMAVTLYDGKSLGVIDLPRNLDDIQSTVMPYLVELLQSYVSEVFSYISVACGNHNSKLGQSDEIKEQYTRVGGVAVEFCVHIGRTDILFDDIVSKFDDANHKETFLELLEPYILKDMLGVLPPEIMQALVDHYSKRGWLKRIEQCVLHMDILSLDFNQVVHLCREHRLHGALIYLFNQGLDDFKTPLEELLVVLRNTSRENASFIGYRILVYLKYCFQGVAFPPGRGYLAPARLPSLKKELMHFLLEASTAPCAWSITSLPSNKSYANLVHLLELDTEATLDVLRCAFTEDEIPGSTNFVESTESHHLIQNIIDFLADILNANYFTSGSSICSKDSTYIWPSEKDVGQICDFVAYYVAYERANVSRDILNQIFKYLTSEVSSLHDIPWSAIQIIRRREAQLLSLLKVVPETHYDVPYLLHMCEKAQFHKVCGYIHATRHHYVAAMECYMRVKDEPIYAFSFIHDMLKQLNNKELDAFEAFVISCIPDLVKLSREATYFLVLDHFSQRSEHIMSKLHSHPESHFLFLKTIIEVQNSGILNLNCLEKVDTLDFPSAKRPQQQSTSIQAYLESLSSSRKLVANSPFQVTDEMTELYFELLCRYDRNSVLKFLKTSESYRVEYCLRLCQEYGLVDAASFLLERVGEVGSALQLILSDLNDKFVRLDTELQERCSDASVDAIMKKREVAEILDVVRACIGLCQRNSPHLEIDESEYLWFQLLDSFCSPLTDSANATIDSKREYKRDSLEKTIEGSLHELEYKEGCKVEWKISKSCKGAHVMRKLLAIFIKETVEGMIGYVRLPRIMMKLISDIGNQEFGDFKLTILGMLGTYDFERRILDTAKSLIEDDTYYIMSVLMKGASHGYAPRNLFCCVCNSMLAKDSSEFSFQVFGCGHAMHLRCGGQENGASSRSILTGCPICTPRKKAQVSSGHSIFEEQRLVSKSWSRAQQVRGTPSFYPHDRDSLDNSYSSQPAPRFELLNNLQRDHKLMHIENTPQLRLAPPAVYHEKVRKRTDIVAEESTSGTSTTGNSSKSTQLRDVKVKVKGKGSSIRFPLKSNLFGKKETGGR